MVVHLAWGTGFATAYALGASRAWAVGVMTASLLVLATLELLRRKHLAHPSDDPVGLMARSYSRAAGPFMRRRERKGDFVAALASLLGYLVVLVAFPRPMAIAGLLCASLGDPAARIAGISFGTVRLVGHKTLQGTAALAAVAYLACRVTGFGWPASLAAASAAVATDLASAWSFRDIPVEDNLIMPIAAATALWLSTLAGL